MAGTPARPSRRHRRTVRRRRRLAAVLRRRRRLGRICRFLRRWTLRCVALVLVVVIGLRWVDPPVTYLMAAEWIRLGHIERQWVPVSEMSESLPLSAAAAEDARFCRHDGFDFDAIRDALADERRLRGASTISQQVAKNVFLWPARSWLRKGLEAGFTVLIELTWPKRRIMEVYLNVAEFGEGVFGVQAAAQHYFGRDASAVSAAQAARLMAILPDPKRRSANRQSRFMRSRSAAIVSGAETLRKEGRADCFLPPDTGA
ncbi:MAG: monofunctional biosynthetic peptidoglycan transglycosylase [Paracoccaceae bacterium]